MARRRTLLKGSSRPKTAESTPPQADESTEGGEAEETVSASEGDTPEAEGAPEASNGGPDEDVEGAAGSDEGAPEGGNDEAPSADEGSPEGAETSAEEDADPSSTVEPLAGSTVPAESPDGDDRQNLADTQVDASPAADGAEEGEDSDSGMPLSHQATKPPAPRQELPPGLANMQTPIRPDRKAPSADDSNLPSDFQETPMGADWYVGTGQPLPERAGVPAADAPVVTRQGGVPVPLIVGVVVVGALVVCAGLWAIVT